MKRHLWLLCMAALTLVPLPATGQVVVSPAPATSLPVVVTKGTSATSATLQAVDNGLPPDGDAGYTTSGPTWSWTAIAISGPAGTIVDITPASGSEIVTVTLSEMADTGRWQVRATATATYNTGQNTVTRTGTMTFEVFAVGVDRMQFQLPGGNFQDVPLEGLYVKAGTTVNFRAIPTPSDAPSWPLNAPAWGGSCGATGTMPTVPVMLMTPSADMSDTQTITAECGNTVTSTIVRYEDSSGTLNLQWNDDQTAVIWKATCKLWVEDANGDGRPDAPGTLIGVDGLDFDNIAPYVDYPGDPPLFQKGTWYLLNGTTNDNLQATAVVPIFWESWEQEALNRSTTPTRSATTLAALHKSMNPERIDALYQNVGDDPIAKVIGKLLNKNPAVAIGKEVLDAVKKKLARTAMEFDVGEYKGTDKTEGWVTATTNAKTKDGDQEKVLSPILTVTAKAYQVPIGEILKAAVLLEVKSRCFTDIKSFPDLGNTYYCLLSLAVADRFPDIRGAKWGKIPVDPANFPSDIPLETGPSAGVQVEKARQFIQLSRSGYVFGSLNYLQAPPAAKAWSDPAITVGIDLYDAKSLFFQDQTNVSTMKIIAPVAKQEEYRDRGYQIGGSDGTTVDVFYQETKAGTTTTADFLNKKLALRWR